MAAATLFLGGKTKAELEEEEHVCDCPSVPLSVCPSVRLSVCPSVHLSVCPSVRLSVCPSVRLYVCLPFERRKVMLNYT